ncbi:putative RNA-binding Zn ribbon-like protein [Prauserella shujinwangii]|uniref:Putative RNA-binding Zn ribbon-like protein n=1 Tax=Prauserella shujinwangii TaxID=1453103 RepID=A0A2T0LS86_9PSEU|nr:CGNR zinc finger domain-containing protein [Prauserella shujinwangii]PRX46530.1 putative RNA-binding Zn ribbon-like protein [Prauserella shujinwangii]
MPFARAAAPGELRRLEDFCNSARFLYDEDAFATPGGATAWLREHALGRVEPDEAELARLAEAREAIRDVLGGTATAAAAAVLDRLAERTLTGPRWTRHGEPVLRPRHTDGSDAVLASLLRILFTAGVTGTLARLKVCRNPDCRWVFHDRSPAANSVWCSMDICGARHKMRAYRARRTGDHP